MIARLPLADRENPDPRGDLDAQLEVHLWLTPLMQRAAYDAPNEPGAPTWWHGDEEASQTFFNAMGIDPTSLGG